MNQPLPRVTCMRDKCWKSQDYRGQKACIHCQKKLNEWQMKPQLSRQQVVNNDHEQDGA